METSGVPLDMWRALKILGSPGEPWEALESPGEPWRALGNPRQPWEALGSSREPWVALEEPSPDRGEFFGGLGVLSVLD